MEVDAALVGTLQHAAVGALPQFQSAVQVLQKLDVVFHNEPACVHRVLDTSLFLWRGEGALVGW